MTKVNKDELFKYYCQDCEEWTFLESPELLRSKKVPPIEIKKLKGYC